MMTKPLPKWVMQQYANLWKTFGERSFDYVQASKILKQKATSAIISHLKRCGWMQITLNQQDSRKRIYKLTNPDLAIKDMAR